MPRNTTVVTRRNYLQRLGDSLVGTLIGIVLILASVAVLFWNEGRAVEASRGLAADERVAIALSQPTVLPANEGKLVHLTGPVVTTSTLTDPDTGAVFPAALGVQRRVEMFQWIQTASSQTQDKLGGTQETTTTYSYAPGWSDTPQDSSTFAEPQGHANPTFGFRSQAYFAADATLGGFALSQNVLEQVPAETPIRPEIIPQGWTQTEAGLYRGPGSAASPRIGDIRVTYQQLPSGTVMSALGEQSGGELAGWTPPGSRYTLLKARAGSFSAAAMFADQKSSEGLATWALRGVGYVMAIVGFLMLLGPLSALANVVPFIATLLGTVSGWIGFMLATVLTTGTIALAWVAVRPLLAIGLLVAGLGLWLAVRMLGRPEPGLSKGSISQRH